MTDASSTPPNDPSHADGGAATGGSDSSRDIGSVVAAFGGAVSGIAHDVADKAGPTVSTATEKATPAVREVVARAADVAAKAADAAGPIAHRVADVTGDVAVKIAERSRGFAADVRKAGEGAADSVGDAVVLTVFETRIWVDGPLQPAGRVAAPIRDLVYEMILPLNGSGHVGGKAIPLAPPARDRLVELRCPVLLVAGGLDFTDVATTARHIEAKAPDARVVVWPDVAHMIGMEVPDRLAETVVEFLAPLPRWG